MLLYKNLLEGISRAVYKSIYESKNISHRTIPRNLWLSVSATCSRNRATEAEFIKPMKKLTVDDLLNRYVAALLIMKKPCPTTKQDIEDIKTFKLFGLKALDSGATIQDIQSLYNINSGVSSAQKSNSIEHIETDISSKYDVDQYNSEKRNNLYYNIEIYSYGYHTPDYKFTCYNINGLNCGYGGTVHTFHIGKYAMSINNCHIFVLNYEKLITDTKSWGPNSARYDDICFTPVNLYNNNEIKYISNFYDNEIEAKEDINGYKNTNILLMSGILNIRTEMRTHSYYLGHATYKNKIAIPTENVYVPSLCELMAAYHAIPQNFENLKGKVVWTSTFKDEHTVYGYDGINVVLLNIGKDKAYFVPFLCYKSSDEKHEKVEGKEVEYIVPMKVANYILENDKEKYRIQDKSKLLSSAKNWNLPVDNVVFNNIKHNVSRLSDTQKINEIIKLLNANIGNHNNGNYKEFRKELWRNNWNMRITGMSLYKYQLFVDYYIQGDSTDADDSIQVNDLVGTHMNDIVGSRFTIRREDKKEILTMGLTYLMYWELQIKKYSK